VKRRKVVAALAVGVASFAVSKLLRRRAAQRRDRLDLYFEDGSMVSFADGSDEGDRLLPIAFGLLADLRG
jgi:hypothetical protein